MKHQYTLFFALLLTLLCTSVRAQTVIAVMDFDGTSTEMAVATDVLFFDNGADGFFGIHNANADDTDGTPMDSGDGNAADISAITLASIMGDFLFVNDLDDVAESEMDGNGTTGVATVTFGPVAVAGETNLLFSFDYDVVGFEASDLATYELFVDGTGQGEVDLLNGAPGPRTFSGTIDAVIPDGTASVYLELRIKQNGDSDQAGFDNFSVTADNTGLPCGVTSFGPTATETCVANTNGVDDPYTLSFDYTGIDAGGTLALLVDGMPASGFTNSGDDPTSTGGGTINISSPDLVEGTSYEVTFNGGTCAYSVSGSVAANTCVSVCDLSTDISMLRLICTTLSNSAVPDVVVGSLDYVGIEPGAVATISGGVIMTNGTNPGMVEDGEINFGPMVEGGSYTITISGGACTGADEITINFSIPTDFCTESDLVVNEVLPNPTGGVDVNQDGSTNSDDEFVELYNAGSGDIDISGYTVEEGAGIFHTFAAGTILAPTEGILIIADIPASGLTTPYGCYVVEASDKPFIGLNNSGTDGVAVRNAAGSVVAQMSYTDAPVGESLALSPDGNLPGGYQNHTTVSATGAMSSPCSENVDNIVGLPIELLSFSGAPAGKEIVLNWATANEVGNAHFAIERRINGDWNKIGEVAAGVASANTYDFYDVSPQEGDNYYRLRQVDLDGATTLYGPVMVAFTSEEFLLFPNPATTEIRFGGALSATDRISLLDANGRLLRELPVGNNQANVSDLAAGVYLVRVARPSGVEVVRFVKQ